MEERGKEGENNKRASDIMYGVEDVPPWHISLLLGFQVQSNVIFSWIFFFLKNEVTITIRYRLAFNGWPIQSGQCIVTVQPTNGSQTVYVVVAKYYPSNNNILFKL